MIQGKQRSAGWPKYSGLTWWSVAQIINHIKITQVPSKQQSQLQQCYYCTLTYKASIFFHCHAILTTYLSLATTHLFSLSISTRLSANHTFFCDTSPPAICLRRHHTTPSTLFIPFLTSSRTSHKSCLLVLSANRLNLSPII